MGGAIFFLFSPITGGPQIISYVPRSGVGTQLVAVAADQTTAIYDGTVALPPNYGFVNVTASGDTTVVAAVVGKSIRVLSYSIGPSSAAVNVFFKSSSGAAISSLKNLAINGGFGRGYCPIGHFQGALGDGLVINLSGVANLGVDLTFVLL